MRMKLIHNSAAEADIVVQCIVRRQDFFPIERALMAGETLSMGVRQAGPIRCDVTLSRDAIDKLRGLGFSIDTKE